MTELATTHEARARASRIRAGMVNYLTLLADIKTAYERRDDEALGYASWEAYVDGEYSEARLKLSPEHRQKAVVELRLSGMSTRAIGAAVGASEATVRRDLSGASNDAPGAPVTGLDGKSYAPTRLSRDEQEEPVGPEPTGPTPDSRPVESPRHQEHADASLKAIDDATAVRAMVSKVLDERVPDLEAPLRQWRDDFHDALRPAPKLMAQFPPERVAEKADDECLDELAQLTDQLVSYRDRVRAARPIPDNVRHLRAVS